MAEPEQKCRALQWADDMGQLPLSLSKSLHKVMSTNWINKNEWLHFSQYLKSLSSLSQCPWKAESKQRQSSTGRAGTESIVVGQNIDGRNTDAPTGSILLYASVVHACKTHMKAEHCLWDTHAHMHPQIHICYWSDVWLNKLVGIESAVGFMWSLKMLSFENAVGKLAGQMHMDNPSVCKSMLWHCCIKLESTDGPWQPL